MHSAQACRPGDMVKIRGWGGGGGHTFGNLDLAQGPQSTAMAAPRLWPAHSTLRRAHAAR